MIYIIVGTILWFIFSIYFNRDKVIKALDETLYATPQPTASSNSELVIFMHMKFNYLHSPVWKDKVSRVRERDNYQCQSCKSSSKLTTHHLSGYDLIPHEPIDCLITLCQSCHQKHHDIFGYPQTLDDYKTWRTVHIKNIHSVSAN